MSAAQLPPVSDVAEHDLLFSSATRIAKAIRLRTVSCRAVIDAHIERIKAVNPQINAVVQLAEARARAEATSADQAIERGERVGPLHGVPITIKDSFDTAGIISTAGTAGRKNHVPARDATVVARLRAAGAIVLGKTNTPELTIGTDTENALFGRTSNPYDLTRTPAGSSGGAAAIIAAGGSALDIGSDTAGSIREPAHVCGIAALKPTAGRVPRTGHIFPPGLGALDGLTQVGPMARYVEDLALVLPIIAGVDWQDAAVIPMPVLNLEAVQLAGLRVAFFDRVGELAPKPAIAQAIAATATALAKSGIAVEEACPEAIGLAGDLYGRLRNADGGAYLRRLLKQAGTEQPGTHLAARLQGLTPIGGAEFSALLEAVDDYRSRMLGFMKNYDAIICPPAVHTAWRHDTVFDDPYPLWVFSTSFNLTGWPCAVLRAGTTRDGLPIGIQVAGRPWREDVVLALAQHIESLMVGYVRPAL